LCRGDEKLARTWVATLLLLDELKKKILSKFANILLVFDLTTPIFIQALYAFNIEFSLINFHHHQEEEKFFFGM
jgi:hypothetical protein